LDFEVVAAKTTFNVLFSLGRYKAERIQSLGKNSYKVGLIIYQVNQVTKYNIVSTKSSSDVLNINIL
jgi:hypothetical protein